MRRKNEAVLCFESNDDGLPKVIRDYRDRYRAIRQVLDDNPPILLAIHRDLLKLSEGDAQLRAVLEVSQQFRIGVLIPMVTTESDMVQVAGRLHELAAEMGVHELPRIGAMIETPAAALSIPCASHRQVSLSFGNPTRRGS